MENNTKARGIGFCGLLTVALIVLRLCGVIGWSWWVVLIPLYAPIVLAVLIFIILVTVASLKGSKK